MKIIELDNSKIKNSEETILALGNFDGLHLGHIKLISTMIDEACKKNLKSAVLLFKDHSGKVLYPSSKKFVLTTLEDKIEILKKEKVDIVFVKNFDINFSKMLPAEFIDFIITKTKCKGIVVGRDYKFGYKGEGDIRYLEEHYVDQEFKLIEINDFCLDKKLIKSTLIRNLLEIGNVELANRYLGRLYSIKGKIVHGEARGHLLGFPTANLENQNYILPKEGVYFTISEVNGNHYLSMTALGENKTFDEVEKKIETYIFDFSEDIYGKTQKLYFIEYMRENDRFPSANELIQQLEKDKIYISKKDLQLYTDMLL